MMRFTSVERKQNGIEVSLSWREPEMKVLSTGQLPESVLFLIEQEHDVEINRQDRFMDREKSMSGISDKDGG